MKKPEVVMINNSTAAIPWLAKSRPDPRARACASSASRMRAANLCGPPSMTGTFRQRGTRRGVPGPCTTTLCRRRGLELTLTVKSASPFGVRVSDRSYGLPSDLQIKPRPADMMPSPSPYSETTYVSKSFKL